MDTNKLKGAWWLNPKKQKKTSSSHSVTKLCTWSAECEMPVKKKCDKQDCDSEYCNIHKGVGCCCLECGDYVCRKCESLKLGVCIKCFND